MWGGGKVGFQLLGVGKDQISGCLVALIDMGMTVAGRREKMKSEEEAWMDMSVPVLPRPCWLLAWALSVA